MKVNSKGQFEFAVDQRLSNLSMPEKEVRVTEDEFRQAIGAYRLTDALDKLATVSRNLHDGNFGKNFTVIGPGAVRHTSGIFITDFAVGYLACLFLTSKSSDWTYKKPLINRRLDNIITLFYIYSNKIETQDYDPAGGMASLFIPMHFEQMLSQLNTHHISARQWYMFNKVAPRDENSFELFNQTFLKETSISIEEYTDLALLTFGIISQIPNFNIGKLSDSYETKLDRLLKEEKINAFLATASLDKYQFRELYTDRNSRVDERVSKTKFNPLLFKPLIKVNVTDYIAPSQSAFKLACFRGVYWWLDNYYISHPTISNDTFRLAFGSIFEEYVGDLLNDAYRVGGTVEKVFFGKTKPQHEFFDWVVETEDTFLLFEGKAIQFPLKVLQAGKSEDIRHEVKAKFGKAIKQMYKRCQDINSQPDLARFKNKKCIPILVCYDIPFASSTMYKDYIDAELNELDKKHPGIKDFKFYMMDCWDLEAYAMLGEHGDIVSLFDKTLADVNTSFQNEVDKVVKDKNITYIGKVREMYNEHIDDFVEQAKARA